MNLIEAFEPSLMTLLVVNLLPFVYFMYHARLWHNLEKLKQSDFGLLLISLIASLFIALKIFRGWYDFDNESLLLTFLHLFPLITTILILRGNTLQKQISKVANEQKAADGGNYSPKPLGKDLTSLNWDNLIISDTLKKELLAVINLLKDPSATEKYGIEMPKGILLAGPPGTGKTTIARVIAQRAGLSFFVLSMDDIVSKWVGESEKNLTKLFQAARKHAPAVIFVDEVDSIGRSRSSGGQAWSENLLNHLLQLIDGVVEAKGLYVIAATNRPDLVDPALKRAGRLNKVIEIPAPDFTARYRLFEYYLSKLSLSDDVDINHLADSTDGLSAADISAICNQAGLNAFSRESTSGGGNKRAYKVVYDDLFKALEERVGQLEYK